MLFLPLLFASACVAVLAPGALHPDKINLPPTSRRASVARSVLSEFLVLSDVEAAIHPQLGNAAFLRVSSQRANESSLAAELALARAGRPETKQSGAASLKTHAFSALSEFLTLYNVLGMRRTEQPELELELLDLQSDVRLTGAHHAKFQQRHNGLEVVGALVRAGLSGSSLTLETLTAAFVPDLGEDLVPAAARVAADAARDTALRHVSAMKPEAELSTMETPNLVILPEQLFISRGDPRAAAARARLAFQIEILDGKFPSYSVYVDAVDGQTILAIPHRRDAMQRLIFDASSDSDSPVWEEGAPVPSGPFSAYINDVANSLSYVYNLMKNVIGYDSFDNQGSPMVVVLNENLPRIDAHWSPPSRTAHFWPWLDSTDVICHEFGHGYQQFTHDVINLLQSGALGEAFSDIIAWTSRFTFDKDIPQVAFDQPRQKSAQCTNHRVKLQVNATCSGIAKSIIEEPFENMFIFTWSPGSSWGRDSVLPASAIVKDQDFCVPTLEDFTGFVLIVPYAATCDIYDRLNNIVASGAVGVIFTNEEPVFPPRSVADVEFPTAFAYGNFSAEIPTCDNITVSPFWPNAETSSRWIIGAEGFAAIRDMYKPSCFGHPETTSSDLYTCSEVHADAGVINNMFTTLVDGKIIDGVNFAGIGLTKSFHVYMRAMSTYQIPFTDFVGHNIALQASCADLIGVPLPDLATGEIGTDSISATDCEAVAAVAVAVDLNGVPPCYVPILDYSQPAMPTCGAGETLTRLQQLDITGAGWETSNAGAEGWISRDWSLRSNLPFPDPYLSSAPFWMTAPSPELGCEQDGSGEERLESPLLRVPANAAQEAPLWIYFQHRIRSEPDYDGGAVFKQVNGGAWEPVQPDDFTFNSYNSLLLSDSSNPINSENGPMAPVFSFELGELTLLSRPATSILRLDGLAPSDQIRIRWTYGVDFCFELLGWELRSTDAYICIETPDATFPLASDSSVSVDTQVSGMALRIESPPLNLNGDLSLAILPVDSNVPPPSNSPAVSFDLSFVGTGTVSSDFDLTLALHVTDYDASMPYDLLIYVDFNDGQGERWGPAGDTCSPAIPAMFQWTGPGAAEGDVVAHVCHLTPLALVAVPSTPTQTRVFGDPHFRGLAGQRYLLSGTAGKVYNLLSTPDLIVNALFGPAAGPGQVTVLYELGIVAGDDAIFAEKDARLKINDEMAAAETVLSDGVSTLTRDVNKTGKGIVLRTPEFVLRWTPRGFEIDLSEVRMLRSGDERVRGLIGQTWNAAKWPASAFTTEITDEAALFDGILDGSGMSDYEVRDGLFGHDFAFSTFDSAVHSKVHAVPKVSATMRVKRH